MYRYYYWDASRAACYPCLGFPLFRPHNGYSLFVRKTDEGAWQVHEVTTGLPVGSTHLCLRDAVASLRNNPRLPWTSVIENHIRDSGKAPPPSGEFLTGSVCAVCVEVIAEEQSFVTDDNVRLCEDCFDERYVNCYQCDFSILATDAESFLEEAWCSGCYDESITTCDRCDGTERRDDLREVSGDRWCEYCCDNYGYYCEACDGLVSESDYFGEDRCSDHRITDSGSGYIRSYNENVLNYCSPDTAPRLFGVELEVATEEDVDEAAEEVYGLVNGDAILKSDSSIDTGDYRGFEIVTRPMTFENQLTFWETFLDNAPTDLRSYDVGTCGLHVHVTKRSISELTRGKLIVFVNDPGNERLLRKIAQRYNCGYSRQKSGKKLTDGRAVNDDRYEFINSMPSNTIEFRLFRGTMNKTRLLACIEFVKSLISFAETASMQALTTQDFLNYVTKEPKLKNLKTILKIQIEAAVENPIAYAATSALSA